MRQLFRKFKNLRLFKNVRNVFTNEQEKEATEQAIKYFQVCDDLDRIRERIEEIAKHED